MKTSNKAAIWAALAIVLLLGINALGWLTPVQRLVGSASRPVLIGSSSLGQRVSLAWQVLLGRHNARAQLGELREQLGQAHLLLVELETLRQDVRHLEQLAGYLRTQARPTITARVLTLSEAAGRPHLLIDQGADQQISIGDLVLDEQGRLVGDIITTGPNLSSVRLLSDPGFEVAVTKPGRSAALGVMQGDFAAGLNVALIPIEEDIAVDDILVTADEYQVPLGRIKSLNDTENELFLQAELQQLSDIDNLRFVIILPSQNQF